MSINTVLTSDKTQFRNYFSDGITIPSNANVALTKCTIDIPIFIQTVLKVPAILAGDRNDPFLQVNIDGIRKNITFTDFFNAVVTYPSVANFATGVERDLTIDNFYSGNYEFFLNNRLYLSVDGQTVNIKPNIMWVLAKVISDRYEFYDCTDCSHYDEDYCGVPDTQSLIANFAGGNVNYSQSYVRAIQPTEYKLNVAYTPGAVMAKTVTNSNFLATDRIHWTVGGAGDRLTSTVAAVNVGYDNSSDIDLNGGYQVVTPTVVAGGITAWGFSLMSHGSGAGDVYVPKTYATIDLATPIIDIGIQFEENGGNTLFKIIDGQHINYDGTSVKVSSNFKPYDAVSAFTSANDRFAIVCRRGNIINNTYEFVFDIKMGMGTDISTYTTIYTSNKTLSTPSIQMVPVFLSNAVANNIFNDIEYIETGADTLAQKNGLTNLTGYKFNTVEIGVGADNYVAESEIRDFVNGMGLNYYTGSLNTKEPYNISYEGTPLNKIISWKPAMNTYQDSRSLITSYWLGEITLGNIFNYSNVVNTWVVNQTRALTDLPKYLNVFLLNHTNKSYSGSFISAVNTQTNQSFLGFSEGEDKVVGTVPIVVDSNISQILNINYEVFNPYYRPIGNPNSFITNDFIIEISYKDFRSDEKKFINDIDGLLKVELNFTKSNKQNIKRITETNELIPLI
tara:strand:+ start:169 stop:2199 length:2031 start_codon:yes stop_codon:yes gene_type:complete